MNPDPEIVAVLEKLKLQYEDALETRRRADARATQLKAAITALEAASAEEPLVFTGTLADACRVVLRGTTQPMSPLEVRDAVKGIGFHLSTIKHDNPMASIHSVLKRLVDSGDDIDNCSIATKSVDTGSEKLFQRHGVVACRLSHPRFQIFPPNCCVSLRIGTISSRGGAPSDISAGKSGGAAPSQS